MISTDLLLSIYLLKRTHREGWIRAGLPEDIVESVGDHSYSTAMLAMIYAMENPDIDGSKLVKMALIHDLPEAKIGDITPGGMDSEKKQKLEMLVAQEIFAQYEELLNIYSEYHSMQTREAKIVADLDVLDRGIQAILYGYMIDDFSKVREFLLDAEAKIKDKWCYDVFLKIKDKFMKHGHSQ